MNKSESINELAAALHASQGKIRHAVKDSSNPFFNSKFADLTSVWDAIRDAFQANGLSVSQIPDQDDDGKPVLVTMLMHKGGQWISGKYPINPVKSDPQGIGSAITYARRYALQAVAGVCADDDDGEAAHGRTAKAATKTGEVKTKKTEWTPAQQTAGGKLRDKIKENAAWDAEFCEIFRNMAYDSVEDTLEALRQFVEGCK